MLTAADWSGLNAEGGAPGAEIAGPLAGDDGDRVVVAVSGIGFGNLNRGAVVLFNLLIERAATLIRELRRLEDLRRITIADSEFGLTSEVYLRNRVREQELLARRHKTNLAIFSCALDSNPPERIAERLRVILACSIRAAVRSSDGIAFFPKPGAFVVLLPQSDLAGAEVVMHKIIANLEMLGIRDAHGASLTRLKWNAAFIDGTVDSEEMYRNLFSGMRPEREATP